MTISCPFAASAFRSASALFLAATVIASGTAGPGAGDGTAAAQASNACALIPVAEVQPLASKETVPDGVSSAIQATGANICRYSWGTGTRQFKLDVVVNDAARMYPGMNPDSIKQLLQASVKIGTTDGPVAEVGDAAVFTADSPVLATTTAYVKGRILQVQLDGLYAVEKKDQMIALLKSAAAKL